jgi:MoaA/NifB/PqqE/SkfB family radical SAM enzyme
MDYSKNKKFCLLPFMTLNTRPNGHVKPCSQVMGMTPIKKSRTADNLLEEGGEYWNLTKDPIKEIWNSDFMRDFRKKKIKGEYIKFCETCYQEDAMGANSKRSSAIAQYYEDNKHLVAEAVANDGYIKTLPTWWELRLSSICNSACRMCIPQTSSKIREEFSKYKNELPETYKSQTETALRAFSSYGYLGDNEFFKKQLWETLPDIKYIEIHGGEPTVDKQLWKLLTRIVKSGHHKHIHIHVHTNIHSLRERHIELWDQFKSGWIGISIDAYRKENDYIRYGSRWDLLEKNLLLTKKLGSHWSQWITSSVMVFNSCTMHRLINWFNEFVRNNNLKDLKWRMDPVTNPNLMRIEHVPMHLREEAIEKLKPLVGTLQDKMSNEMISILMKTLRSVEKPTEGSFEELIEYTRVLDIKRKQNVLKVFPHLKEVFDA